MRIVLLYNNFGYSERGCRNKVFEVTDDKSLLEMILWLTGCGMYPRHTPERIIKEVIVNGKHFETNKYLNPCDWSKEIKEAVVGK